MSCPFCTLESSKVIDNNDLALVFYDSYPVTKYHTLIIPRRHVPDYFELTKEEVDAMHELMYHQKKRLLQLDDTITGFNIGINVGKDAGQSIFHVHLHLIPRRKGDMKEPKGGVRGVIPGKQKY